MKASQRFKVRAETYHVKTDQSIRTVERMAALGLDESEIAYCTGIDPTVLRTQYKEEMDMGLAAVTAEIGISQIQAAKRGDSNAAQFFLRARSRWVTPTKIDADVTVTVKDKRQTMDEIVKLMHSARAPLTIEHEAQPKASQETVRERVKALTTAKAPTGKKLS